MEYAIQNGKDPEQAKGEAGKSGGDLIATKAGEEKEKVASPSTKKGIRGGLSNSAKEIIVDEKQVVRKVRGRKLEPVHEEAENPLSELDKYFKKTKTQPAIYYLPLTEEEVKAKGAEEQKKKKEAEAEAAKKMSAPKGDKEEKSKAAISGGATVSGVTTTSSNKAETGNKSTGSSKQ